MDNEITKEGIASTLNTGEENTGTENTGTDIIYVIDEQDRLVLVNEQWMAFAQANQAEKLDSSLILHRSLWDFVVDRETRLIYDMMFHRVREGAEKLEFQYRCDTPTQRRLMQMTLSPQGRAGIRFISHVLREEDRPPVLLLDPTQARSNEFLTICGWCKKIELPDGSWAEVESAIQVLQLFDAPLLPQLSHGICPECLVSFRGWRTPRTVEPVGN
jgi:hypothetical protein